METNKCINDNIENDNVLISMKVHHTLNWYMNDLTIELDKNLTESYKNKKLNKVNQTYIIKNISNSNDNIYIIRKFGATRGCIFCDSNDYITDITLLAETGVNDNPNNVIPCYTKKCLKIIKNYIGFKFSI